MTGSTSSRSTLAVALCAAALLQAGCADGGGEGDERIGVPQLRMIDADATPLTLGAPGRIESRDRDAFERASLAIERTVWVRPDGTDAPACVRLGRAGPGGADAAASPERGFRLEVDPASAALATLAGLDAGAPLSLLVSWSVPASPPLAEPILLDAAEYRFEKAAPDAAAPDVIVLRSAADAPASGADGTLPAAPLTGESPCGTSDGPLGGRPLGIALNPDGDALDSLAEIDAGLPAEAPASASIPVPGGDPAALDGVDAIVVADERERALGEPLPATRRIGGGTPDEADATLSLRAPDGSGEREPLELRVALTSDGRLVLEVVLPPGLADESRDVRVAASYSLRDDGVSDPMPFGCPLEVQQALAPLMSLSESSGPDGLFLDASGRVLARCSSPEFAMAGQGGIRADDTFSLLVDVAVREEGGPPPARAPEPLRWNTGGERVLVYRRAPVQDGGVGIGAP